MNIYKSYIGRSVTHNRQSSFDIDLRICQFHGLKVMGVSVHQTDSYTNRYWLTNSVCCVKSEFVSAQVYSVWVSVRINYVSDKAIPASRLLVCKIDKNESVLFRYKVIYMKKGEKKSHSLYLPLGQQIIRFVIQVPWLTVCCAFSSMIFGAGTGLIPGISDMKKVRLWLTTFFSCLWSENDIVQLLTLGQQCQVLSFLLLSICNWHLFLLDCNEFLVETPKWNPHHWYLQARTSQLEDSSSRWTYRYQWKEKDKIKLYICCLLSFYCVTVCI